MLAKIVILAAGAVLLSPVFSFVQAAEVDLTKLPPASTQAGLTYDKDVKGLFDQNCIKCHGPAKQKARVRLDSLEAALKGGEHGKVILPGRSAQSPLVHCVARLRDDTAMPPKKEGKVLSAEQVGVIRAWIDQGAK